MPKKKNIPVLGICRGISSPERISWRNDPSRFSYADHELLRHAQPTDPTTRTHSLNVNENTLFAHLFNDSQIRVNSFHHQVIDQVADDFEVGLVAPDGVVEGFQNMKSRTLNSEFNFTLKCFTALIQMHK